MSADREAHEKWQNVVHTEAMQMLRKEFGYEPSERDTWIIFRGNLIVINVGTDRHPRLYEPGCAGAFKEMGI